MPCLERFVPPELSTDRVKLLAGLAINIFVHRRQLPPAQSTNRLLSTYFFTTDKAVRKYTNGCHRVKDHMARSGNGDLQFLEGMGHFENCIHSVRRALRVFERLGSQQGNLLIDRVTRECALSQEKTITNVRNRIEHIDEDIVKGPGIAVGTPHILLLDKQGERLEIGARCISIIDLHNIVNTLYLTGVTIIRSLPATTGD